LDPKYGVRGHCLSVEHLDVAIDDAVVPACAAPTCVVALVYGTPCFCSHAHPSGDADVPCDYYGDFQLPYNVRGVRPDAEAALQRVADAVGHRLVCLTGPPVDFSLMPTRRTTVARYHRSTPYGSYEADVGHGNFAGSGYDWLRRDDGDDDDGDDGVWARGAIRLLSDQDRAGWRREDVVPNIAFVHDGVHCNAGGTYRFYGNHEMLLYALVPKDAPE
jgi:hypothetical protein